MKKMTSDEKTLQMGTRNMIPLVCAMVLPAVFANLSSAIYNIVDRIFMGGFVGNNALGAIAVTSPLISIMAALSLLITIGGAALLSICLGKKDYEKADRMFTNMLVQAVVTSCILALIYCIFAPWIVTICGAGKESKLYEPAVMYLRIISIGLMFHLINAVQASIIRAEGNAAYSMLVSISGGLMNIVLDALLVIVFAMGLKGAAAATVISQIFSAFLSSIYFLSKKSIFHWKGLKAFDLRKNVEIMKNGAAPAVLQILIFLTGILSNNLLRIYGDTAISGGGDLAIAVMSVIATSETICITVIMGINQGTNPIISYNYGAGNYKRMLSASLMAQIAASIIALLTWIVMIFFPQTLFNIFASKDAGAIMEYGCHAMRLCKMFVVFSGIQTISSMFFSAIGKPKTATIMSIIKQALFLIPLMLILPALIGLDGVLIAYSVSDLISAIVIFVIYIKGIKKIKKLA